jgi:hypothetical protein
MNPLKKWLIGIVIPIMGFVALFWMLSPNLGPRQRSAPSQATQSAVQAALRYALKNGDLLPQSLDVESIKKEIPEYYKGDIAIGEIIYLPPVDRSIRNLKPETVLVLSPTLGGAWIGHAAGNVEFIRTGENIRGLTK